ncbi:MAG: hypothetical protein GX601_06710 [Anaerolineales bacterium]|jgi:hypothetical protein|nr:hypothetical protein [Anaerolineales bacterium]
MRLSDLGRERTISVQYEGAAIAVTFSPKAANAEWLEQMASDADERSKSFVELLADVLVHWDVEDDDGQPLPPTAQILRQVPFDLLNLLGEQILESLAPKKANARP